MQRTVPQRDSHPREQERQQTTTRFDLPVATIVKVVLAIFIVWLVLKLWSVFLLVLIAFLLAAALSPPVAWLERRGWPLGVAVSAVGVGLLALIAVVLGLLVPQLVTQGQLFAENLPEYIGPGGFLERRYPDLYAQIETFAEERGGGAAGQTLTVGVTIVQGLLSGLLTLVLAFYLLLDGERAYRWVARYLSPVHGRKLRRAMPDIVAVVSGYVIGQSITSLLFGVFAYVTLSVLGVPEALLLAVLAAFMDAIPLVGVPIATVPAVLIALTVSTPTAVAVLVLYIVYQQIENYVIMPRIYGTTLKVSPLSILIGVLVGGQLLGVTGILLALPITAAIPVIERIWHEDLEDLPAEIPIAPEPHREGETAAST
jgi:predicted PurR-regulated permease PerM